MAAAPRRVNAAAPKSDARAAPPPADGSDAAYKPARAPNGPSGRMSDSSFLAAVGADLLGAADEGGWASERLPIDDIVAAGFGAGARAEDAADLLPPEERARLEFAWAEGGLLDELREAELAAAGAAGGGGGAKAAAADDAAAAAAADADVANAEAA